ncbi:GNAT family N-acetyltransferase [Streptomyces sp. BE147]|uniref:GNAT family N-acetyltransferase n=1 Tax=unclassified Streptomyces TaxID=2593676 RepID=UPI002E78C1DA|nr:GNAT family N-acetyltransferase [Streptomyces sp. BE147]MEE1737445.1 GNAT family N-acetyltransferase [Streptomyces sp. BE147]
MIRTAAPADLDAIVRLHTEARATYYRDHLPVEEYAGEAEVSRSREGWSGAIDRPGATVLCAERDGALAGVAAYSVRDGVMRLTQLHVAPSRWRTGIGTALHTACTDAWRRTGVRTALLEVFEPNAGARSFYAHHGWTQDPDTPRAGDHLVLRLALGNQ